MSISSMQPKIDRQPVSTESKAEKPKEIERKFLLKNLPYNLDEFKSESIEQGYIVITPDGTEVRLRKKDGQFYQTVKSGSGEERTEHEIELSKEQFDEIWDTTEGKRLKKTRFKIPYQDKIIELDIYGEGLAGNASAEVEFKTKEEADKFTPPEWFGREVTEDSRYKNQSLATKGWPRERRRDAEVLEEGSDIPEYELDEGVRELIESVKLKAAMSDDVIIVAVAGGSASGKTSLVAQKVLEAFGDDAKMFSMDNYFKGKSFIESEAREGRTINFDMPDFLDLELIKEHLQALKRGENVQMPIYSFQTGEKSGTKLVKPKRIIILEGIHALNGQIKDEEDVKAFVEIGMHGRMMRRLLRDIERTGRKPYDILKFFTDTVEPMHEEHIESTKKNADMVIKNEYHPEVEAQKSGKFEFQLKFKLDMIDSEALRKAGAQRLSVTDQVDYYYNPKDRDLKNTGEILRVRNEGGHKLLTYKGPLMDSKIRKRPIFEFEIDDMAEESLLSVYGDNSKIINKTRELYQLDDCVISMDSIQKIEDGKKTDLGDFLEIRLSSGEQDEKRISAILNKLQLNLRFEDGIKEGYFEM